MMPADRNNLQSAPAMQSASAMERKPDIGYVPTPPEVVEAMLTLADVTATDVLYVLGSGDGRIVIMAAQRYGTRGVGIDIDPQRIEQATEQAKQAGVSDRVTFYQQDLFKADFSQATIVVLYLLPHLNLKLRSTLRQQLQSGARIISRDFDLGDWPPDRVMQISEPEECTLYCWTVGEKSLDRASN